MRQLLGFDRKCYRVFPSKLATCSASEARENRKYVIKLHQKGAMPQNILLSFEFIQAKKNGGNCSPPFWLNQ
jgi:hypothetical protein